jgi:hypothetical protein
MIVDTTRDCVELQYAAKRRASSTVVDGTKLESLRAMQQDLSGKMICRDRTPGHNFWLASFLQSRATSLVALSRCFGHPLSYAVTVTSASNRP